MQGGWNRWSHKQKFGPLEMTPPGPGEEHYRASVTVPKNAYRIDFVFSDVEDGPGTYDNRGGLDYGIPVDGCVVSSDSLLFFGSLFNLKDVWLCRRRLLPPFLVSFKILFFLNASGARVQRLSCLGPFCISEHEYCAGQSLSKSLRSFDDVLKSVVLHLGDGGMSPGDPLNFGDRPGDLGTDHQSPGEPLNFERLVRLTVSLDSYGEEKDPVNGMTIFETKDIC